jgi:hypothetical protein
VATIERASRTPVTLGGVTVGDQIGVRGAPLALIDAGGSIAAVVGDVVWIEPRG